MRKQRLARIHNFKDKSPKDIELYEKLDFGIIISDDPAARYPGAGRSVFFRWVMNIRLYLSAFVSSR